MALTLEAEQRLENVELTGFFTKKMAQWKKLAEQAYKFVKRTFPDKATIRHDDVAKTLVPVLEVHKELREFLAEKKLKQKYWVSDFVDLVLDRTWGDIQGGS